VRTAALVGVLVPLAACDDLLKVDDPDVVTPGILADSSAIPLRVAGTLSDFQTGFSGASLTGGVVPYSGLFTDELYSPDTYPTRTDIDLRDIDPNSNGEAAGPYVNLHRARIQARGTAALVEKFEGKASANYGIARNMEGYTQVLFGENWCSGVPFSEEVDGELQFGQPETTKQIFERAVATFNDVLSSGTASQTQIRLASIGKARALLNLGDMAGAAAAVQNVPTTFVYRVEHSANSPAQENPMWALQNNGRLSLPTIPNDPSPGKDTGGEGTGGNTVNFLHDPRVPWHVDGVGFDKSTPLRVQELYTDRDSDVPLATGVEARLIEAEALLNKGASNAYLASLNSLRADYNTNHGLTGGDALLPLVDPGTAAGRVNQFFAERAYFLYLTGHRLGDLRRLIRFYGRTQEQVFPTGSYHKESRTYRAQTSFPIPVEEKNNPNFTSCLASEGF
jgi:hypothetical protein